MLRRLLAIPVTLGIWFISALARNWQNIATAFVQVWAHKGRSILTMLGIIIAVTSIITVVSFVEGFGNYVANMLRGYGAQYIVIRPGLPWGMQHRAGMRRANMDMTDVEAVRTECDSIKQISPFIFRHNEEVSYAGEVAKDIPIRGVSEQYQTIRNFFVDTGRFFGPMDVDNAAQVCVLGRSLLNLLQCDESLVGDYVYIRDRRFRVVGLLESKGSFMGDDQDETVMIPYTTALNLYPDRRNRVIFLAEATSEDDIDQAEAQMTQVLRRRHRLQPGQQNDFHISRQDQTLNELKYMRIVATSILAGIVSISLLVGGIGIMNVMLVSITERTREIGLRKSVGGRRRDIMLQFLTEAVVLSTLGGTVGIALGYVITHIGSLHPEMVDITVSMWSVALAFGFSAGAGILFGVIPAFKAAIIHPIDALRHE